LMDGGNGRMHGLLSVRRIGGLAAGADGVPRVIAGACLPGTLSVGVWGVR